MRDVVLHALAVVAVVIVLYWAIYLPNPGGLSRSEEAQRLVVRVLAVVVMTVVVIYLVVSSLN